MSQPRPQGSGGEKRRPCEGKGATVRGKRGDRAREKRRPCEGKGATDSQRIGTLRRCPEEKTTREQNSLRSLGVRFAHTSAPSGASQPASQRFAPFVGGPLQGPLSCGCLSVMLAASRPTASAVAYIDSQPKGWAQWIPDPRWKHTGYVRPKTFPPGCELRGRR